MPETDHQGLRGRAKLNARDHIEGQRERKRRLSGAQVRTMKPKSFLLLLTCYRLHFFFPLLDFYGTISNPDLGVYEMEIGPIIFQVASGDISKEEADVIVNSTSKSFNLKAGTYRSLTSVILTVESMN